MAVHVSVNNGYLTMDISHRMSLSSSTYFLFVHDISIVNKNYKCYTKQKIKIIVII